MAAFSDLAMRLLGCGHRFAVALTVCLAAVASPTRAAETSLWGQIQQLAERHGESVLSRAGEGLSAAPAYGRPIPGSNIEAALDEILGAGEFAWRRLPSGEIEIFRVSQAQLSMDPLAVRSVRTPNGEDSNPAIASAARLEGERVDVEHLPTVPLLPADQWFQRAPNVIAVGDTLVIRGVERGSNATASSQVYLDGMALPSIFLRRLLVPSSLNSVAFLRGPRNYSDGLGGLGGAVRLNSRIPRAEAQTRASVRASEASQGLGAEWEGPVSPLASTARFGAYASKQPSTLSFADGRSASDTRLATVYGRSWFEPDLSDELRLDLGVLHVTGDLGDERVVPRSGNPVDFAGTISHERAIIQRTIGVDALSANLLWLPSWGGAVQAQLVTSRGDAQSTRRFPGPFDETSRFEDVERLQSVSVDWRLELPADVDLTLGASRSERQGEVVDVLSSPLESFFPPGSVIGLSAPTDRRFSNRADDRTRIDAVSIAIGRYSDEFWWHAALKRGFEHRWQTQSRRVDLNPGDCTIFLTNRNVECADEFPQFGSELATQARQAHWIPHLTVGSMLGERTALEFRFRRGLLPGGARLNPANGSVVTYRAERSDSAEVTMRWRSDVTTIAATVFRNRWLDRQVRFELADSDTYLLSNAGEARAWGGEIAADWGWSDQLAIRAGVGWLRSKFVRIHGADIVGTSDLVGKEFPSAPRWTATLAANWRMGDWSLHANAWATAAAFSDSLNSSIGKRPGYALVNVSLSRRWTPSLQTWIAVDNVFDRAYVHDVRVSGVGPQVIDYLPGEGRRLGVGLQVTWQ